GRTLFVSDMDSVVSLVLCEAVAADWHFHLDSRHAAASAHGPTNEFCLALYAHGGGTLAGLRDSADRSSLPAHSRAEAGQEICCKNVSLCGLIREDCHCRLYVGCDSPIVGALKVLEPHWRTRRT